MTVRFPEPTKASVIVSVATATPLRNRPGSSLFQILSSLFNLNSLNNSLSHLDLGRSRNAGGELLAGRAGGPASLRGWGRMYSAPAGKVPQFSQEEGPSEDRMVLLKWEGGVPVLKKG